VHLCLLIYTLKHTSYLFLPIVFADLHYGTYFSFSHYLFLFPLSLILCTGDFMCLAIHSAACRACLIASLISILLLWIMGTTRRRDAATTAHSTPSTCRATACASSAPTARTRTVLVLSIALSSLLPGAPLYNAPVAVCCSVMRCVVV